MTFTRRVVSVALYDNILDIRLIDGKVSCDFSAYREIASAMRKSGLDGRMLIDLRDIGYWANAVAAKLDELGGEAPKGDLGITMRDNKILQEATDRYPEKAKELYGEAIRLLKKQATAENWPPYYLFADEELGNQYGFKIANYESYMPVIQREAPERAIVLDNGIGWGRKNATEYAVRDHAPYRCYNSWTEESLETALRDHAEISTFNYGNTRLANGFTQFRLHSTGHLQWADLWDSYNYQWQYTRLTEAGVMSSLEVENRHEGVVDYAATCYLETLIAQAEKSGRLQLAADGRKVLNDLISDLEITHVGAQAQGKNITDKELKKRRWHLFAAIEEIKGELKSATAAGTPQLNATKSQRIAATNEYLVIAPNHLDAIMAPTAELTEDFWSEELGPFQYIQEYVNTLRARASVEEDFIRWNQPTYGIARIASLPEGLAIYTEAGVVQPKPPYLYQHTDDDGDMWQDDCIEVFFSLPNSQGFHFMFNSAGKKVFLADGRLVPAEGIKSYIRYPLNDEGGTANKLLIPWRYFGLDAQPIPGTTWRFNICREFNSLNNRNLSLTCWAPVFYSFHEIEKWGTLTFSQGAANNDNEAVECNLAVEVPPTSLVISGDDFICYATSASPIDNLILEAVLTDSQGKEIRLNEAKLPLGEAQITIGTAGLRPGVWKVELQLKGTVAKSPIVGHFTILPNPWQ